MRRAGDAAPRGFLPPRWPLCSILALAAGAVPASASPEERPRLSRPGEVSLDWDGARCFAYSDAERGYACLDSSAGADAGDPRLRDFETLRPPRDTAWLGHKAVLLVAGETRVYPVAKKPYGESRRIVRARTAREAIRAAMRRGYQRRVTRRRRLPAGRWRRFHGVWLRFDTRMHEGGAGYQNHGSLRLRCEEPVEDEGGRLLVEDNQAERATAFAAPGAGALVVGFVEVDGGEGAAYSHTSYVRVDASALCP